MNFDLKFYLSRFMRRFHYFALVVLAVSAIGLTVAYVLPPVYRAQATLLVESPQIPDDLASSTVQTKVPEILSIIQQRIGTRANLVEMSRRLGIHTDSGMTPDQIVEDIRNRMSIVTPRQTGRVAPTPFVTVSFTADSAGLSATVTNDIVTQILQENVALRTTASGQTLEFFDQQVTQLSEDLALKSQQILKFKLENKDALPDSLDYRRAQQGTLQERLLQLERDMSLLADRRTRLVELYERTGQVSADLTEPPRSPQEQRLQALRERLAEALVLYAPQNPRIKVLEAQVKAQEKVVATLMSAEGAQGMTPLSPYELQLSDFDAQIAGLREQKEAIEVALAQLKVQIDATPANAIELDVLQRDYNAIQAQYALAVQRQAQAATGDRIEALSKGQRITVVEQAVVPSAPVSPQRMLIAGGSIAGGIVLGAALVFLLEFLNRSIQRPVDLANRLGLATFGAIPYIMTHRQSVLRRNVIMLSFMIAMIGIPAALYAAHVYYLPMDLLIRKVLEQIGVAALAELRPSVG